MENIKVLLFVESRYKVNRKRIKRTLTNLLKEHGIKEAELSVAVIGDRKMKQLNKQYRSLDKTTNVLSFSIAEGETTVLPPSIKSDDSQLLRLGDVVISYPKIIEEAAAEDMLVDDKVDELLSHGTLHLLGIHH